jgi:hypothetical protein
MRAADQWATLAESLGEDWAEVRLVFTPEGSPAEAAAALAPLGPGRAGDELLLEVRRAGGGPERLRNVLRRLDAKRVWGTLRLLEVERGAQEPVPVAAARPTQSLAGAWDDALAALPPGWSDLLCELELDASDLLPRAALLGAPLNPTRNPNARALRFRVAGKQGYGTSPGMARRCLERMDGDGITGRIHVLNALSDTENVVTQGPVWRVEGRSV